MKKYWKWSAVASRNVRLAGRRMLTLLDRNEVLGLLKGATESAHLWKEILGAAA